MDYMSVDKPKETVGSEYLLLVKFVIDNNGDVETEIDWNTEEKKNSGMLARFLFILNQGLLMGEITDVLKDDKSEFAMLTLVELMKLTNEKLSEKPVVSASQALRPNQPGG